MSQTIIIRSVNYDGEIANIIFTPYGDENVLNLGDQVLPFEFSPSFLVPPKQVYGTYTILILGSDCPNILNVPKPTPTPTPTPTVTRTQTPTATPTQTPTPSFDPCKVPTPTPTITTSPTTTPTNTPTPTETCTNPCGCPQPSKTPKPSKTPRPTPTMTKNYCPPSSTPSNSPTPTPTLTPTGIFCNTFTFIGDNASTTINSATKTTSGGWDSIAYSLETYIIPVSVTFQTSDNGNYLMGGFSYTPTSNPTRYINTTYGFYVQNNFLEIYEYGNQVTVIGPISTLSTDIWKVDYNGTNVKYYHNSILLYTSLNPVTNPLHVFFALLTGGQGVTNVCINS